MTVVDVTPFQAHVEIDITGLPVGTATILVERVVGSDVRPVRGARDLTVAGTGALVRDWEIPLGVEVTYRVVARNAAGGTLGTGFAQVELPGPTVPHLWLSDPLEENSARLVVATNETDTERTWGASVSQVVPFGRALPSLTVGSRARLSEWPLTLLTQTQAEADEMRAFMLDASFILIRPPANMGLPPLLYGSPASIVEVPHPSGVSLWRMPLTVSGGPLVHIVAHAWTYGDLEQLGLLYGDLPSMFPTYRDLQRGPA